ncbi:MAG: hypothetical protein EXQ86_10715 [Rhodospirillales bacterium]|nr:hypothetical protein [Rhodospirillales bacterium]
MRWLPYFNVAGLIVSAAYSGLAVGPAWKPFFALGAGALFLIGLVMPLFAEYRALGKSFQSMESSFLQRTRKPHFPSTQMEIYTAGTPSPVEQPRRMSGRFALALAVVAVLLVGIDVVGYVKAMPAPAASGKITNF